MSFDQSNSSVSSDRLKLSAVELVGWAVLASISAGYIWLSWGKWHHAVIDFGRELYTPWALSQGLVLYRDVDGVYGPLSQYWNALVFSIFGPGRDVIVGSNLVILAGSGVLAYRTFKRAWGIAGGLAGCGTFLIVFAFAQYGSVGGFNYIAPYAHEATHGFFLTLLFVEVGVPWVERSSRTRAFVVGFVFGLIVLVKPEFILAAALVLVTMIALRWLAEKRLGGSELLIIGGATIIPVLGASLLFWRHMDWGDAIIAANNAWLVPLRGEIASKGYQQIFLGIDRPWANFVDHLKVSVVALGVIGSTVFLARGLFVSTVSRFFFWLALYFGVGCRWIG